jgi:hypothetical protein
MLAVGMTMLGRRALFAQEATPASGLPSLDLPQVTIVVDDKGFSPPTGTNAGRVLMTVENTGTQPLHFFAVRVPDEVSDAQLESDMAASDAEPAWFDMTKLTMLGNPDWPAPGGSAEGIVDVTAGRWVLVDPISSRNIAVWIVGDADNASTPLDPAADVEVELIDMDFTGLEQPVPAGARIWKIANRGALEHELALLPVSPGTTKEDVTQTISDMLQGKGDPNQFAPVGGQGIASKGVTSWQHFDLAPGTYAAVCMSPAPGEDFAPHALMGMIAIFTVE